MLSRGLRGAVGVMTLGVTLAAARTAHAELQLDLDREPAVVPAAAPPAETIAVPPAATRATPQPRGIRECRPRILGITGLVLPATTREIGGGTVDTSILGGGVGSGSDRWSVRIPASVGQAAERRSAARSVVDGVAHGERHDRHHHPEQLAPGLVRRFERRMRER